MLRHDEEQPLEVVRWQTPWPMVQVSDVEWVIIRDDAARPVAIVRHLLDKPGDNYRVVRWASRSEDRRLFEYFPTLEKADMAVTFTGPEPRPLHTALSEGRSPEWGRFERWFWSQAPEAFRLEAMPAWAHQEARMRREPTHA